MGKSTRHAPANTLPERGGSGLLTLENEEQHLHAGLYGELGRTVARLSDSNPQIVAIKLVDSLHHLAVSASGNLPRRRGRVERERSHRLPITQLPGVVDAAEDELAAPDNFGTYSRALLVGNFGDGAINAFDSKTFAFLGQLQDATGQPLKIDGLWALSPGNGSMAGSEHKLYFSAGPNHEADGLFGYIKVQ